MELDDLFKKFHLKSINNILVENEVMKNNQKANKKIIYEKEGIYVWCKIKNKHRLGRSNNVYSRINVHNSSNMDKIMPELIAYLNDSELVENLLKFVLEKYLYRCEFYDCDIAIIEKAIIAICKFLKKK